jgi:hypothetical protein
MAIQNWRLSQLTIVGIAGLCAELWAIRAMLRMEKQYPLLAGVDDLRNNPFRDLIPPLETILIWKHFTLEAFVFAIIPGVLLFVAWRWVSRNQVTPDA